MYVVRGEFLGDLPGHLTSGGSLVGSGKACLAYIQTPDDDRHLARLPKRFFIDGDTRINITRPGRMRQPSQPASSQAQQRQQLHAASPPLRSGPLPIRQRQCQRSTQARARARHSRRSPHLARSCGSSRPVYRPAALPEMIAEAWVPQQPAGRSGPARGSCVLATHSRPLRWTTLLPGVQRSFQR